MERWKRRRYVRSSTLLLLLLIFLIWYWWTHAPVSRPTVGPRSAEPVLSEAGVWIVEPLSDSAYLPVILGEIQAAERSIAAELFVIRADEGATRVVSVMEALIAAAHRGVRVRILLDKPSNPEDLHYRLNREAADLLRPAGIEVRFDHSSIEMHDKMILFDEDRFIVGAHNWTENALAWNRELSLLIRPVDRYAAPWIAFETLWQGGLGGEESRIEAPGGDENESGEDAI